MRRPVFRDAVFRDAANGRLANLCIGSLGLLEMQPM